MFNHEPILNQLKKFLPITEYYEFHTPEVRLSNLIFLQDDLRVQSNTPTDATTFTQVCYIMHFPTPAQTEYFKLGTVYNKKVSKTSDMSYMLEPPDETSFVTAGELNYEIFLKLAVTPAKITGYAGWNPSPDADKLLPPKPYLYKAPITNCKLLPFNNWKIW